MNSPARIGRHSPFLRRARPLRGVGEAAPLDRRLREAVGVAEVLAAGRQRAADLGHDGGDAAGARDRLADAPVALGQRLAVLGADHHQHVRLARPEAVLPVLRRAVADVAEQLGARSHAGAELRREGGERGLRQPERAQALVAERDVDAGVGLDVPALGGDHLRDDVGEQRPRARRVLDPQEDVAGGGQPVAAHHEALEVGEVELGHAGNASSKRAFRSAAASPWAPSANSIRRVRLSRFECTCSSVWPP